MRAALLCSLLAFGAAGQETFRIDTRLVLVNVTAEDKQGRPVADLTAEDFTVIDGKKPEKVSVFARHADGVKQMEAAPLPPGTFTNRVEAAGPVPVAVTAIVIDQLNTPWEKQHYNRDLMLKMLQNIDPQHRVSLYVLGTQVRILHDFTNDTESLIATLRRVSGTLNTSRNRPEQPVESGPEMPAGKPAELSAGPGSETQSPGGKSAQRWAEFEKLLAETERTNALMDAQRRAWMTLNAVEAVGARLARIPGRKNLVWVSSGFPIVFFEYLTATRGGSRPAHMVREFERTARALANSGIAVYSVNGGDSGGISVDVNQQQAISAAAVRRWEMTAWNTMLEISSITGGRAFGNVHQFDRAMKQAAADSRMSYTVGFYPSHDKWDGSFREIKVKVNREGVRLRHRDGYIALAPRAEAAEERRASLQEAAWSPLDATAIPIDVRIAADSRPGFLRFLLMIDPAAVNITQKEGLYAGQLDLLYVQQARDGSALKTAGDGISLKLPEERYRQLMRQRLGMNKEVELAPGAATLRIVVRDPATAATGSVTVPLEP